MTTPPPRPGRPPLRGRPAKVVTQMHVYAVRSFIFDLQVANGLTDTEMLQVLTSAAAQLAVRLPAEPETGP